MKIIKDIQTLKTNKKRSAILCIYTSFLSLGLISIFPALKYLGFVALVPFLYYVEHIKLMTRKEILRDLYWGNFILVGLAFSFLFQLSPENWSVILNRAFSSVAVAIAWQLVCMFAALCGLLFGYVLYRIKDNMTRLLLVPILWPLNDLLRSLLISIVAYGAHGSITPNFHLGSIAVIGAATPLVYSARIIGFIGLGFLMLVCNLLIYFLLTKQQRRLTAAMAVVILSTTLYGWKLGSPPQSTAKRVVVIHLGEKKALDGIGYAQNIPDNIDLLVLPEYSDVLRSPDFKQVAAKLTDKGVGVTSRTVGVSPQSYDNLVFFNNKGEIVSEQSKRFLIPTGEYMPYSLIAAFKAIGQNSKLYDFTHTQKVIRGPVNESAVSYGDSTYGALVCSGVLSLTEYHTLTQQGADVLINTASLSFLQPASRYNVFAERMARFQAVYNNRPFVQASRSSQSFIITNQGEKLFNSTSSEITPVSQQLVF